MAKAFYSTVLDRTADDVWAVIRPFDHYRWAGVDTAVEIEEGKAGDQVGAVRRFAVGDKIMRQKLLAHSDLDRACTYAVCEPSPLAVRNYVATLRVTPVAESGKAFVEWSASFDCDVGECSRWIRHFEQEGFAKWLGALREFMERSEGDRRS